MKALSVIVFLLALATPALAQFASEGEWVTTESGQRVCRLAVSLSFAQVLTSSFCTDWQPGFPPVVYAQTFPFEQGWIRKSANGFIQIHVEDRWVP